MTPDLGGESSQGASEHPCVCRVCECLVAGPPGTRAICSRCYTKEKNIADTGSADLRRVWRISRHQRRRMIGMSRSRQGR